MKKSEKEKKPSQQAIQELWDKLKRDKKKYVYDKLEYQKVKRK